MNKKKLKVKLTPCVPYGANLRVKEFLFSLDESKQLEKAQNKNSYFDKFI